VATRLDEAISQWTNSLIFAELASSRASPAFLWATDDTPRTWLGHTIGGVGMAGDNPDAIYRLVPIDGAGRYEILGSFDQAKRPAQLVIEVLGVELTHPEQMFDQSSKHSSTIQDALITDRDLVIGPNGEFRITLGGSSDGHNHIPTKPGHITVGVRDMLSDWAQRPCRLTIRRVDCTQTEPVDAEELRRRIHADLSGFVRFWAAFPNTWFGGLKPNTIADPAGRPGGWGFIAGLRFQLSPGEAILVTTGRGDARYTGSQVIDPWMIGPDARQNQVSLNLSQATPDADGSFTYVIAPSDPGVANWLDTAGLHEGFAIFRWQGIPRDATKDGLLRDFRVVGNSDIANAPGIARVSPKQRKAQLAARLEGYDNRVR
jgi:hypothetical protein